VIISGMSGNEIYCLAQKGLSPGEITVGNSVRSMGVLGGLGAAGRTFAGGEIRQVTEMISEGRHAAIQRMEQEAQKRGANGVTGVVTELRTLAGYTEFLSQGTGVHTHQGSASQFFSTAASGIELYCHLDAGYHPMRFVMGNVAYALGAGRGLLGSIRTLARGEVREFSDMYNRIRHVALERLRAEAAAVGANSVVDVKIKMLPYGPGTIELLMTGTASFHPMFSSGPVPAQQVITSELTGEELWNLAAMGLVPYQLIMATSVYSLGVAGGIGAMFRGLAKGELPELTHLIYEARENCLELVRREATALGAERVLGNKLQIREIAQGMIEIVAVGTAVRRASGTQAQPATPQLIAQAVIVERDSLEANEDIAGMRVAVSPMGTARGVPRRAAGCIVPIVVFSIMLFFMCFAWIMSMAGQAGH